MLDRIREGAQGPWAMAIIALIVLSFVFAGVGSYLTGNTSTAVASVNGEEISAQELERAYQNQRSQMESQFGEGVAALFADPAYVAQFRQDALDRLVRDLLLKQFADSLGLRASDEQVRDAIVNIPGFQIGGQFNNERYIALIRQLGYQPAEFRDFVRRELSRDQLSNGILTSGFAMSNEARRMAVLERQQRSADTLIINALPFADTLEISDAEIQEYYNANITQFDTEEKVDIAYVLLAVDDLRQNIDVSSEQAQEFYQNGIQNYRTEATRNVSHILVEFGEDKAAAEQKIQALQTRLNSGEDFAELAKAESDDTFSAEGGGDLGTISEGMMGEAFEAAAFALENEGDVSDIVETEFGYHLILATQVTPETTTPFAEVEAEIIETLQRDGAIEQFYELQAQMAQLAFEVPESLEDVSGALDIPVQTTGLFGRDSAPELFNRGDLIAQAFSSELIEEQLNSDVIEIDDDNVLVMRVVTHEPQRTRTQDEVSNDINSVLLQEKAQQAAQSWAEELVTKVDDEQAVAAMLEAQSLSWQSHEQLTRGSTVVPSQMIEAIFRTGLEAPDNTEIVTLGNGNVGVVRLTNVIDPAEIDTTAITQLKQRMAAGAGQTQLRALVESLRQRADIVLMQTPAA